MTHNYTANAATDTKPHNMGRAVTSGDLGQNVTRAGQKEGSTSLKELFFFKCGKNFLNVEIDSQPHYLPHENLFNLLKFLKMHHPIYKMGTEIVSSSDLL